MSKIFEGANEALAVARGEVPAASILFHGHRYVPHQPSLDPISDAIRDHYLSQARSADQVRRIKSDAEWAQWAGSFDEDDGA